MMTLPGWMTRTAVAFEKGRRIRPSFVENNMKAFTSFLRNTLTAHEYAIRKGLLQAIDPRGKIIGFALLIAAAGIIKGVDALRWGVVLIVALAWLSSIDVRVLVRRALPAAVFTFFVAVPYALDYFSSGTVIFSLPVMDFGTLNFTEEGLFIVGKLLLRVFVMVSLLTLFILSTKEADIFSGLRALPLPGFIPEVIFLALRYSFVLLKIAEDSTLSRKSRVIRKGKARRPGAWFALSAGNILKRAVSMSTEVSEAMRSRGFNGELRSLPPGALLGRDYVFMGFSFFLFFMSFTL